jgi:hypothetical protein
MTSAIRNFSIVRWEIRLGLAILIAGCGCVVSTVAQVLETPNSASAGGTVFSDPDQAAQRALLTLGKLIAASPDAGKGFGIKAEELRSARLGKPVEVFAVRADELSKFRQGNDERKLLHDQQERIYPIVIDNKGRALIRIKYISQGWIPVAWGEEALARNLVLTMGSGPSAPGSGEPRYVAVEIPSMRLSFLAPNPPSNRGKMSFKSLNSLSELKANQAARGVGVFETKPDFTAEGQGMESAATVFASLAKKAQVVLKNRRNGPGF